MFANTQKFPHQLSNILLLKLSIIIQANNSYEYRFSDDLLNYTLIIYKLRNDGLISIPFFLKFFSI